MAENSTDNKTEPTVIIQQVSSSAVGICALIFAVISVFFAALLFVPLSLILAIIAIGKKQYVWGLCAIIVALVSAFMSPSLWFVIGTVLQFIGL
jgi:hypothetical protein